MAGPGDVYQHQPVSRERRLSARHAASSGQLEWAGGRSDSRVGSREWPLLADDMFRMAHRDNGSCRLDERMAGLVLAAALLGELMLTGRLSVEGSIVRVLDAQAPGDVVAHAVLDQIVAERVEQPVREWLAFLGDSAYAEVASRLMRSGHVRARMSRRPLNRSVKYVPTDMNAAAWPWARLTDALRRERQLDTIDVLLGGLAVATDLHRSALVGDAGAFATGLNRYIENAPAAIRGLITHTRAAAGDAVITKA